MSSCETCGDFVASIRIEDIYDIEDKYEKIVEKLSKKLAHKLRHAYLPLEALLDCFSSLNPFEILCVFLKARSFGDVSGGNLWIEYLESEMGILAEQCTDAEKQIFKYYMHINEIDDLEQDLGDKLKNREHKSLMKNNCWKTISKA